MERKILFRLDDVCPRMNHGKFNRMKEMFLRYNVKPIIGVVPECRDDTLNCDEEDIHFWEKMKELQNLGWTIAMHGCFHSYVTKSNGILSHGFQSEFSGLSYQEQYEKLEYGVKILESHGISTDVFMAPSHSYDRNTLRALKTLGFQYITDGLTAFPYRYMGLLFIPCIDPKITNKKRFSTVCYHTNEAKEARYVETEAVLTAYRDQVISFEDAKQLQVMPYWKAKVEEVIRYIHKYILIGTVWEFYKRVKN